MTKYINDLTEEKVQLTNVIRHLSNLQRDYPKGTYDVSAKLLNDSRDKLCDKLRAAEHAQTLVRDDKI
jgi:hypothetical protein